MQAHCYHGVRTVRYEHPVGDAVCNRLVKHELVRAGIPSSAIAAFVATLDQCTMRHQQPHEIMFTCRTIQQALQTSAKTKTRRLCSHRTETNTDQTADQVLNKVCTHHKLLRAGAAAWTARHTFCDFKQ